MNGPLPSDAAAKLRAELRARIEYARDALERPGPDFVAYELRGRIKAYRDLLQWIDPPVKQPEPASRRLSQPPNY